MKKTEVQNMSNAELLGVLIEVGTAWKVTNERKKNAKYATDELQKRFGMTDQEKNSIFETVTR